MSSLIDISGKVPRYILTVNFCYIVSWRPSELYKIIRIHSKGVEKVVAVINCYSTYALFRKLIDTYLSIKFKIQSEA